MRFREASTGGGNKTYGWAGGSKALYRTRGIHCLSSFKGRVNGWARLRRPGRLVMIGEERAENVV